MGWQPMHLQPVFARCARVGGAVSENLFKIGLCLPSGAEMTKADLNIVCGVIRGASTRLKFIKKAFDSNYIAPAGPQEREFESKFAEVTGFRHCAAVVSGAAALHLALRAQLCWA
jgi:dTDP-4-amino-4,6-dideoxygalactose transaminase